MAELERLTATYARGFDPMVAMHCSTKMEKGYLHETSGTSAICSLHDEGPCIWMTKIEISVNLQCKIILRESICNIVCVRLFLQKIVFFLFSPSSSLLVASQPYGRISGLSRLLLGQNHNHIAKKPSFSSQRRSPSFNKI